jgi:hypothetical protein
MPISFVGVAAGVTSATLPSFNRGDIAVVYAFRDGSTTNPSVPTGWTSITSTNDGTTCSASSGWRRLQEGDTTTGTWTNASRVVVAVYRGCEPFITPVGGGANGAGTTNTVSYTTFTLTRGDGTSWVLGHVGHRSVDTTVDSASISGMTARGGGVDATAEAHAWDTNGGVSSWGTTNQTITGTASGWVTRTIELLALPTQSDFRPPVAPVQVAHSRSP